MIRDVLLNLVPMILRREIYASAAMVGASLEVLGEWLEWQSSARTWVALVTCFGLRYLALRYKWHLPRPSAHVDNDSD